MDPQKEKPRVNTIRKAFGMGLVVLGVAIAFGAAGQAQGPAAIPAVGAAANPAIATHLISQAGKPNQLVLVDTNQKVIAVYQIDPNSGVTNLASVRNVTADLQMLEYNTEKPLPSEIREGLQTR